jgi:hypothetical protein
MARLFKGIVVYAEDELAVIWSKEHGYVRIDVGSSHFANNYVNFSFISEKYTIF